MNTQPIPHPAHRPTTATPHPVARRLLPALVLGLLLGLLSCDGAGDEYLFSLDGTGAVEGLAFLDLNRDGLPSGGEPPLAGVDIRVFMSGSQDTVARLTTDESGTFEAQNLRVGSYQVSAGGPVFGDSLVVTGVNPDRVEITPDGNAQVSVGISFPLYSFAEARQQAVGTRLYVEGVVLNDRGSLPNNAVHVWDGERAMRAVNVESFNHSVGDSIRMLGWVSRVGGRTTLTDGRGFRTVQLDPPDPIDVTTQRARSASDGTSGGVLDGALVRVTDAVVSEVRSVEGGIVATASDGSGPTSIRIPNAHLNQAGLPTLQPGAVLSVSGILLFQEAASNWELRTRSGDDITAEAQGGVTGRTFFDRNGSGTMDPDDTPLADVRLRLFQTADLQTPVAEVQSDSEGRFQIAPLDVDSYVLEVDETTIPDSLVVRSINPGTINVPTGGGVEVSVVISHPQLSSTEIRELPEGETVFLQGTALNARSAFGDNSVHIRDDAGALRTLQVDATVLAGDRLRVRGRTARVAGQMVLTQVTPFVQAEGGVPGSLIRTAADARIASGGVDDAQAVRVREVTVVTSGGNSERWIVTVQDDTGQVTVYVRLASVGLTPEEAEEKFETGERLNINGVLIPEEGTNRWRIHPRTGGDLTTINP